jgi:hypothetical protein
MTTSGSSNAEDGALLPRAIADAAAAATGLPFGPAGPFVAAVTAPYLELVAQWVWDKVGEDAKKQILRMLNRAWHATGMSSVRFANRIGRNEQTRLLTANAIRSASSTAWRPKVTAIGDLLARGLIADDEDEIDLVALGLAAMAEMERSHVSLLELLVNYVPGALGWPPTPYPRYLLSADSPWDAHTRRWTAYEISTSRPKLKPALAGLMGTLVRHGLAVENNEAAGALEEALQGFERRAQEQAEQIRAGSRITAGVLQPHIPEVPKIVPTWSPTELGENLLGLYRQAAPDKADKGQAPVGSNGTPNGAGPAL